MDLGDIAVGGETRLRDQKGRFLAAVAEGAEDAAAALADEIAGHATLLAPHRTGHLASTVEARHQGTVAFAIATAPHAAPQEHGAGPHDIPWSFGRDYPWGYGENWGRPGAWHPGNPATNFLSLAGRAVSSYATRLVARYMP